MSKFQEYSLKLSREQAVVLLNVYQTFIDTHDEFQGMDYMNTLNMKELIYSQREKLKFFVEVPSKEKELKLKFGFAKAMSLLTVLERILEVNQVTGAIEKTSYFYCIVCKWIKELDKFSHHEESLDYYLGIINTQTALQAGEAMMNEYLALQQG